MTNAQTRPLAAPRRLGLSTFLCLAIFATAGPVAAQSTSPLCDKNTAGDWPAQAEMLVGSWSVTHLAGYAESQGVLIPFPADAKTDPITLSLIGGDLIMAYAPAKGPITLRLAEEPRWETSDKLTGKSAPITPDDAAIAAAGCDQMALPRLIGETQLDEAGVTATVTVRLMVMTQSSLYGGMEVDAKTPDGRVIARRAISVTRTGQ